eukprot:g1489.t1
MPRNNSISNVLRPRANTQTELGPGEFMKGILVGSCVAISWLFSTQMAKSSVDHSGFQAPFFINWFTTLFNILIYPTFLAFSFLGRRICGKSDQAKDSHLEVESFRESKESESLSPSVDGLVEDSHDIEEEMKQPLSTEIDSTVETQKLPPLKRLLIVACFLYPFWASANYLYVKALLYVSPSDVTAVFASASVMVYLLELVVLDARLSIAKGLGTFFAVIGVILICYSAEEGKNKPVENFTNSWKGVFLTLTSAACAAFYKVFYKGSLGDESMRSVSLYLTLVGCIDIIVFAAVPILRWLDIEQFEWRAVPWGVLTGHAIAALAFNFSVNFGISITYPLFISIGTVAGIPLNELVDYVFRNQHFGVNHLLGASCIVVSFFLMLLSVRVDVLLRKIYPYP